MSLLNSSSTLFNKLIYILLCLLLLLNHKTNGNSYSNKKFDLFSDEVVSCLYFRYRHIFFDITYLYYYIFFKLCWQMYIFIFQSIFMLLKTPK